MSWSLGEIRNLAKKAAKGAGFSWGLADDASFAVEWLHQRGAPGITELTGLLSWREAFGKDAHEHCPITIGTRICDTGSYQNLLPLDISNPLLLTPFIASTLSEDEVIELRFQNNLLRLSKDALQIKSNSNTHSEPIECSVNQIDIRLDRSTLETRVSYDFKTAYDALDHFAQATYAPSTEESRLKGAGAGNSDND